RKNTSLRAPYDEALAEDDALVLLLEPLDRLVLGDAVLDADARLARLPPRDAEARPLQAHVEVHAVDAGRRVVLDAEVDVLRHAEAEVARRAEVLALELVLLHLQTALENLRRLLAADRHVDGDLLVSSDGEAAARVPRLRVDRLLARELLEHARRARQSIARLAHTTIEDQLRDLDLAHLVLRHG
ncbi:unnamed protein product, partial [Pelagomonas calceolata]